MQCMKRLLNILLASSILATTIFAVAPTGVDSFEIYLNNKLISRHSLEKPLQLENLDLTGANANDQLVIRYLQCNAPNKSGKQRTISIKDDQGKTVKMWKFKDAENGDISMTIPVKEILEVQQSGAQGLVLLYNAEGRNGEQKLALL